MPTTEKSLKYALILFPKKILQIGIILLQIGFYYKLGLFLLQIGYFFQIITKWDFFTEWVSTIGKRMEKNEKQDFFIMDVTHRQTT